MDDSEHQALDRYEPDTALTRLIRIPVRIVVLVLVLPVRMVWDLLAAGWHAFDRTLLRPLGRGLAWLLDTLVLTPLAWLFTNVLTPLALAVTWLATALFIWPWIGLWRYVVVPVAKYGVAVPLVWLYANLLTPLGRGAAWLFTTLVVAPAMGLWRYALVPAARYGVIVPLVWLYGAVLTPVGHGTAWTLGLLWQGTAWVLGGVWKGLAATGRGLGIAVTWLVMTLLVAPASWLYRRVLAPVGREIAEAAEVAWRIAGYLSRAVGRGIAWLFRHLVGVPVAWAYRTVGVPVGHFVRDGLWAPARRAGVEVGRAARGALATARETVRQARRDAWRALVGGMGGTRSGEPLGVPARTLGSTTTVPSAAQASETSLLGEKLVKQG
ncbi:MULTISPECIES: hypothetical protein [unclassified Streptomyces]|uniref:hypothetical protein n=1 Tax=unclassified Streptomyces TaxID=2593676 RepID=UPI001929F7A7|nr:MULTISPECIES: hypothetical protein [unclassified Streptomyces]CAD5947746.1 conserved membrane protein of unknown function [Streptomyces sp. KY75]CAD5985873.1 conserved membrane protein of unknown function [Streptomyces sp. KY70]